VKTILAENYVRPDEAEKIKSKIKERGSYKVIDKVTVRSTRSVTSTRPCCRTWASRTPRSRRYVKQYEKLLVGGIWCIVTVHYFFEEGQKGSPFSIGELKPIQMPNMDLEELFEGRRGFRRAQWIDVLCRSTGMEPANLDERVKWHLLARMIPFVENNYNVCELGPRGTGKSHIYKEISPNSILISGGQTTVANLFYNMARRRSVWSACGTGRLRRGGRHLLQGQGRRADHEGLHGLGLLRPRARTPSRPRASMVFVGNINQPVDTLVKTSHLLAPFPGER
jgi:ATP-dependent Lon protease